MYFYIYIHTSIQCNELQFICERTKSTYSNLFSMLIKIIQYQHTHRLSYM